MQAREAVHRHVELCVPEDLHHDPRVYVQVHEQGRAGAPGVVHIGQVIRQLGPSSPLLVPKFRVRRMG